MNPELKRKFVKDFSAVMLSTYSRMIKPNRSQSHRAFRSRMELRDYLELKPDMHWEDIKPHGGLLDNHVVHLYEMRDYFLSFAFSFPCSFTDYDDLTEKTTIICTISDRYRQNEQNMAYYNLNELKQAMVQFDKINGFYDDYGIITSSQDSPDAIRINLLKFVLIHQDKCSRLYSEIITHLDFITDVLGIKFEFTQRRAIINRTRKQKKKNPPPQNPVVRENLAKIRELQKEIDKLTNQNEQIKREDEKRNNPEFDGNKTPAELQAEYRSKLEQSPYSLKQLLQSNEETFMIGKYLFQD